MESKVMLPQLVKKLKNKVSHYDAKFRSFFDIPVEYQYKDFSILLPANHLLPSYQKHHVRYDRFLPHLSKYIQPTDTIVDVGANVGDTLAGMVEQNSVSTYVCVEPDDAFFEHLSKNIERIRLVKKGLKVHAVKSLVGKSVSGVSLEGVGGTKHAVLSGIGQMLSKPLDEIIADLPSVSNVRILKTDVDGFDYDVLDSSFSVIRAHQPLIFLECQFDFDSQRIGYKNTLASLEGEGYCDWVIFDNFGEVILRTGDLSIFYQMMDYVWRQNSAGASRTIYYFDVLVAHSKDRELVDGVLASYH